ncbi:MAG: hypothetical protein AB1446_12515 [Bacillota bacterium]
MEQHEHEAAHGQLRSEGGPGGGGNGRDRRERGGAPFQAIGDEASGPAISLLSPYAGFGVGTMTAAICHMCEGELHERVCRGDPGITA